MSEMVFQYNDGGRALAGYSGTTGDCVCRSIAIATERPYLEIYNRINEIAKSERIGKRKKRTSNARIGVYKYTYTRLLSEFGWVWTPTVLIGSGARIHLLSGELPMGRLVVRVSKHVTAVVDGEIHDVYNCARGGTRCVYGYWQRGEL